MDMKPDFQGAGRLFDPDQGRLGFVQTGQAIHHRSWQNAGGRQTERTGNGVGRVASPRREVARRNDALTPRSGNQRNFRQDLASDIAHARFLRDLETYRFQPGFQMLVGIQFLFAFMPCLAHGICRNEDKGGRKIDQRYLDAINRIDPVAGREEAPGFGARGVLEVQFNRCSAARNPVYSGIPSTIFWVLILNIRKVVTGEVAETSPFSIANGPTPASMFPQFGVVSTVAVSTETWAKR